MLLFEVGTVIVKKAPHSRRKRLRSEGQKHARNSPVLFPDIQDGRENPWLTRQEQFADKQHRQRSGLSTLELCAGGGGQSLGFEQAGIDHAALVELDKNACATLRLNRPLWNVVEADINEFDGSAYKGVDIVSGGLPCPPFSIAGKQLGHRDERNLFPAMIRLVDHVRPKAILVAT